MNTLQYTANRPDGIFSEFTFEGDDAPFMVCAAHAYEQGDGDFAPIVAPGIYTCKLGTHQLHDGIPFQTYEILGVAGHSGLLFHCGNFPWSESQGCNLVGSKVAPYGERMMVLKSGETFRSWMARLDGADTFQLQVLPVEAP